MNFKKMTALFALLSVFSMFAEDLKFDSNFTGWTVSNRKKVILDNKIKEGGTAVRLENDSSIRRNLDLEPNTKYKLSFRIKGQDIASGKNQGARIMLNAGKNWGRITAMPQNEPDTGTFDWKEGSGIIDTAKFKSGTITIYFSIRGTGTVWYDDVKIEKQETK